MILRLLLLRALLPTLLFALHACNDGTDLGACRIPPPAPGEVAPPAGSNGSEALCARRYDEVTYATAHNAMSNRDEGWYRPNQRHGIERALEDGVRGLMLDAHPYRGEVYLCHGVCEFGRRPMQDALCGLRAFLARNPGEVVTLLIENHVPDDDLARELTDAGLGPMLHAQPRGAPWPTLGEMVASGRRLVVFVERGGGSPAWLHSLFAHAWDTPYRYDEVRSFDCAVGRGDPRAPLFTLNHFLTRTFGSEALARDANAPDTLRARLRQCAQQHGRRPNFVAVDFYEQGAVREVVRALNEG